MDLHRKRERKRKKGSGRVRRGIKNGVLGLIMYTGQPEWSAALGSDIYSWGEMKLTTHRGSVHSREMKQ